MVAGLEPFLSKKDTERGKEESDEVYGSETLIR
jgi:hypothetical protein